MKSDYLLIMGDFNYGNINWIHWVPTVDRNLGIGSEEAKFVECLRDCFLSQHVAEPTRVRINNVPSILDLIFTNEEYLIDNLIYHSPLGKSDHCVLTFHMMIKDSMRRGDGIPKLNYSKADYSKIQVELKKINWVDELGKFACVDEKWAFIRDRLTLLVKTFTPVHRPFVNTTNREFTIKLDSKTLKKRKEKTRAWRKYRRTRLDVDYRNYTRLRNQLRNVTRHAHKRMEKEVVQEAKSNPKRFWKYVNGKTKMRAGIPDLKVNEIGDKTNTDVEKAEVLSKFFTSVFTPVTNEVIPDFDIPSVGDNQMPYSDITLSEVKVKLKNLNVTKSPGPDNIHPRILHELREELAAPLTIIFNDSLDRLQVPTEWKMAHVSPIFKKGGRSEVGNYRPVSLTSVVCKVLESIIKDKIMLFMTQNELFCKQQFGFLSGRSTCLQLLKVMEDWTRILDEGGQVDSVYFDFQKAFDKVSHQHLLKKLAAYNIHLTIAGWISSFLKSRKQRVSVAGSFSEWTNVTSGIPQGSVLGPILFIIYINDLPDVINSKIFIFADDTKIYRQILSNSDHQQLQEDICVLEEWAKTWKLKFHPAKCKVMTVCSRFHKFEEFDYKMKEGVEEISVMRVSSEKDLGVTFDDKLKFGIHIAEKTKKANQILGVIRRSFVFLDRVSLVTLYKALVRPHLEFSQVVWSPYLLMFVDQIESVQRRATRLVPGMEKLNYSERLRKLKLPSLAYRRLRGDLIETFKIKKHIYDPRVTEGILNEAVTERTRGTSEKLFLKGFGCNLRKNAFSIRVVKSWNMIPQEVIDSDTVQVFEGKPDKFLRRQPILYDYRSEIIGPNYNQ